VRPALARVKASLFDILTSRGFIRGERILDAFAGSGALGIEALSRGATSVVFIEQDREVVRVLRRNLEAGGLAARSSVIAQSAGPAILRLLQRQATFDGVLLDPPYDSSWAARLLPRLGATSLVREGGWVAVHHRSGDSLEPAYGHLIESVRRRIGSAGISVYWRHAP
jgi:16S rRNA (guanine(966)-N(2))-methyltransferase RsmD